MIVKISKSKIFGFALALFPMLFNSCLTAYVPNTVNTPLFSNKGEFTANLAGGISGVDAQAAYAITDKFAVMANTSFSRQNEEVWYQQNWNDPVETRINTYSHTLFEGGFGYYKTPNKWINFEIFSGFGLCNVDLNRWDGSTNVTLNGNYSRFFLQPSMGIVSNYIDLSFTPRVTMVNFSGMQNENISRFGTGIFIEPNATVKVGFEGFKFFTQFGFAYKINTTGYNFDYHPFMFTVGAQVTIGRQLQRNLK